MTSKFNPPPSKWRYWLRFHLPNFIYLLVLIAVAAGSYWLVKSNSNDTAQFYSLMRTSPRGTRITYHQGPCLNNVTRRPIGKAVAEAYAAGKCIPVQKKIRDGVYRYFAVVM